MMLFFVRPARRPKKSSSRSRPRAPLPSGYKMHALYVLGMHMGIDPIYLSSHLSQHAIIISPKKSSYFCAKSSLLDRGKQNLRELANGSFHWFPCWACLLSALACPPRLWVVTSDRDIPIGHRSGMDGFAFYWQAKFNVYVTFRHDGLSQGQ